jgi:hypothetical protein
MSKVVRSISGSTYNGVSGIGFERESNGLTQRDIGGPPIEPAALLRFTSATQPTDLVFRQVEALLVGWRGRLGIKRRQLLGYTKLFLCQRQQCCKQER